MTERRISHFELIHTFHEDRSGSFHLARDVSSGTSVAVQLVRESTFPSEDARARFIDDATALIGLRHENVAAVTRVEESDEGVVVVYETLDGEPLAARKSKLSPRESMTIMGQVLEGLRAAHARGVIHGSLAPEHVFVTKGGAVKLACFGTGRLVGASDPARTDVRLVSRLSPETVQALGADEKSDLWAAGVLLYEMLTGHPPFEGPDASSAAFHVLSSEPPAVSGRGEGVPPGLAHLVSRLLAKDPAARPESVDHVIENLESLRAPARAGAEPGFRPRIAVMYFSYGGAEATRAYLATGITEEVISRLSRVERVAVASRTDVLVMRGRRVNPTDLARCMDLDAVVEGTVWHLGDRTRVEVRLINGTNGRDAWSGTFDGLDVEVFRLAPAIANEIVEALDARASSEADERLGSPLTRSEKAYDFYARGREFLTHRGMKNTEAAMRMFQYAVLSDPAFAAAHESLAAACSGMYLYYDGSDVWLDRMARAAGHALEIDPSLVDARFHLAMVSLHRRQDEEAREEFERIIRAKPDYYEAYRWMGILSDITGAYDDALSYYDKSAEIKPCSVEPWLHINMTHRRRGDVAAAKNAAKKFVEIGLKALQVVPDDPITLSRFCVVYTLFGEREKAYDALTRILNTGTEDGLVLYNCAATYALLGDHEASLDCLRKALSGGYKNVREWIEKDPDFDEIRKTEGFRDLLDEFDRQHLA